MALSPNVSGRLSLKLAGLTVIIAIAVGLLTSSVQIYLDYLDAKKELNREIDIVVSSFSEQARRAVFQLDPALGAEVVEAILREDFVTFARIVDDAGRERGSASREMDDSDGSFTVKIANILFKKDMVRTQPLALDGLSEGAAGELSIGIDNAVAMRPFVQRAETELITGILRSCLLATLLYFAFHWGVTRPLTTIVEEVSNINPDQPGEQRISEAQGHENDELGKLVKQMNSAFDAVQVLLDNLRATNRALTSSEEALRKRSWELEQEVERTKQTTLELIATKEQAEAANRAKSVFLANVSHELRTPLNAIIGFSSIMADQMFGPIGHDKYHEYLSDIRNSSQHLSEILGEVLDLAKIEAGQMKVETEDVDLVKLCEESVALVAGQAAQKQLTIKTKLDKRMPQLRGDRLRIKQAVLNLLSNAVKFTEEGGRAVQLDLKRDTKSVEGKGKGDVLISVTDHGIGIAAEEHDLVFSPFIRSSSALSRSHEGTGLGLSLVRAFVDMHGGRMELDSAPGRGSIFTIRLPSGRLKSEQRPDSETRISAAV